MFCPSCKKEIEDNSKFCPHCGTMQTPTSIEPTPAIEIDYSKVKVCRSCNRIIPTNAWICPNCGHMADLTQTPNPEELPKEKNGIAVAGFICSFFIPLLGLIFGCVGLSRSKKRNDKGKGLSIAAIIISIFLFISGLSTF